ncbi:7 transmembrane sweet-taste receptor of 3 GCPR-domain-containing protein [Chytriomyces cf. hyalinus JEL632]|nr:7 transmembrane sweet-taste receptor of 3 GCPR-domain-containing protein [Chytriomyces cf. hyalinus JEL632]
MKACCWILPIFIFLLSHSIPQVVGQTTITCGPYGTLRCDSTFKPVEFPAGAVFAFSDCTLIACPVWIFDAGAQVTLSNVTFRDAVGEADSVGGNLRFTRSVAVLENVRFINNSAPDGGAIGINDRSVLSISNAFFDGNKATAASSRGGGDMIIQYSSTVTCKNCTTQNSMSASVGGGFVVSASSLLTWTGGSCVNNTARWAGCVMVDGASRLMASNIAFRSASAVAGGAIFLNHESVFNGTNLAFKDVYSTDQGGFGGTAVTQGNSRIELHNSRILGSVALGAGGALLALGDSFILLDEDSEIRNAVGASGAAIANQGGQVTLHNSRIINCTAVDESAGGGAYEGVSGAQGALYTMNAMILNNTGAFGGAFRCGSKEALYFGTGTVIDGNTASQHGGAIYAITQSKVHLNASVTISNNHATGGTSYGGAIFTDSLAEIQITGLVIARNNTSKFGSFAAIMSPLHKNLFTVPEQLVNVEGRVFVYHSDVAAVMLKAGTMSMLPKVAFSGRASGVFVQNQASLENSVVNFAAAVPDFFVEARDMFGNQVAVSYYQPVIVTVSEVSRGAKILGETTKAILDDKANNVRFSELRIRDAGPFVLQVSAFTATLDLPPGSSWQKFNVMIAVCNPVTERLFVPSSICVPVRNVSQATRYGIVFTAVAVILFTLSNLTLLAKHRRLKLIRSNSIRFLAATLLGVFLSLFSIVVQMSPFTHHCQISVALDNIGFSIIFGSLCVKAVRIQVLFDQKRSQKQKVNLASKYNDNILTGWVFVGCAVMAAFLAAWFTINSPEPVDDISFEMAVTDRCNIATGFGLALTVLRMVIILFTSFLAFQIRNVPSVFNESKVTCFSITNPSPTIQPKKLFSWQFLGFTAYNWFLFSALLNALVEFSIRDPNIAFILRAIAILVPALLTVVLLYSVKLYVCVMDPDAARFVETDKGTSSGNLPSKSLNPITAGNRSVPHSVKSFH